MKCKSFVTLGKSSSTTEVLRPDFFLNIICQHNYKIGSHRMPKRQEQQQQAVVSRNCNGYISMLLDGIGITVQAYILP